MIVLANNRRKDLDLTTIAPDKRTSETETEHFLQSAHSFQGPPRSTLQATTGTLLLPTTKP
jgi:hypothetical protein